MKAAIIAVVVLVLLSAFFVWRYYSREARTQERIESQGMTESDIEKAINTAVEDEVNAAVENITEADIEAALLGQ
jgi:predicted negative regulator of RcsB-dependent stress response